MTGFEQRNNAFSRAMTDVQMAYIDAERKVAELEKENAKLRDELKQWERLADGIELPEYPITQFEPKDLERENKELRKVCLDLYSHLLEFGCMPNTHKADFLPELRELGILTCSNCANCEAHGYPPEGIEKTAFTISLWCPETDESKSPYESCSEHELGEPRIVRDDMDDF